MNDWHVGVTPHDAGPPTFSVVINGGLSIVETRVCRNLRAERQIIVPFVLVFSTWLSPETPLVVGMFLPSQYPACERTKQFAAFLPIDGA